MAKIVIGALGKGNIPKKNDGSSGKKEYEGTRYDFGDDAVIDADYSVYAVTKFEKPDRVVVLLTEGARGSQWQGLKEWLELEGYSQGKGERTFLDVSIPDGATQNEAWNIFQNISQNIPASSEVVIDITFGLRSIPVLMLSAVRYLQRANNVRLSKIYYGALESKQGNVTPMYSLDSFITLLDWATAVDIFKRTGSSLLLADLLGQQHNELKFANGSQVVHALRQLSLSLDLLRSQGVLIAAHKLVDAIKAARKEEILLENEPIVGLMEQIADEFQPIAMGRPRSSIQDFLRKTLRLVEWYQKRNRYADALFLSREWCISWIMFRDSKTSQQIFNKYERDGYAKNMIRRSEVNHFWRDLARLRNRLAHTESHEAVDGTSQHNAENLQRDIDAVLSKVVKLGQML
jgi:CRISPR-associated DxTHG motif protein